MMRAWTLLRRTTVVAAMVLVVALPGAGQAQPNPVPKPKAPHVAPRAAAPQAPIICTKRGCNPLPPNCHAEREETWEGPTGYQMIVCP